MPHPKQRRTIQESGVILDSFGYKEIVIATHGGYTPKRNLVQTGSGSTTVPAFVTQISFYSEANVVSVGNAVAQIAVDSVGQENARVRQYAAAGLTPPGNPNYQGAVLPDPVETSFSTNKIINYSLTNNGKYNSIESEVEFYRMDVLRVRQGSKVHLEDIWAIFKKYNLKYDIVHFGACRINKLSQHQERIS